MCVILFGQFAYQHQFIKVHGTCIVELPLKHDSIYIDLKGLNPYEQRTCRSEQNDTQKMYVVCRENHIMFSLQLVRERNIITL